MRATFLAILLFASLAFATPRPRPSGTTPPPSPGGSTPAVAAPAPAPAPAPAAAAAAGHWPPGAIVNHLNSDVINLPPSLLLGPGGAALSSKDRRTVLRSMHPSIVLSGPDADGHYEVATMSNNFPIASFPHQIQAPTICPTCAGVILTTPWTIKQNPKYLTPVGHLTPEELAKLHTALGMPHKRALTVDTERDGHDSKKALRRRGYYVVRM